MRRRHLHRDRGATDQHHLMAPVELVGLAGREAQRHEGIRRRGRPLAAPAPGITPDRIIAARETQAAQLLEYPDQGQPVAAGRHSCCDHWRWIAGGAAHAAALLGLPTRDALLLRAASFAVLLVSVQLAIATLYRFGPARPPRHWRLFSTGAVTATLLWAVASFCFSLYVSYFASYDTTYGALGAAVALLTWLYVSVYLILLGAELDAALAKAEGAARSPAEPRPIIPEAATVTARRKDTAR